MEEEQNGVGARLVLAAFGLFFVVMFGALVLRLWSGRDPVPPIAEIHCQRQLQTVESYTFQLSLYVRGTPLAVPAGIGHRPDKGCTFWIHTETADGRVHVDSPEGRTFTLGDVFMIWGQPLSSTALDGQTAQKGESVAVWVDGQKVAGPVRDVTVDDGRRIVVALGPPWPTVSR